MVIIKDTNLQFVKLKLERIYINKDLVVRWDKACNIADCKGLSWLQVEDY